MLAVIFVFLPVRQMLVNRSVVRKRGVLTGSLSFLLDLLRSVSCVVIEIQDLIILLGC